MIQVQDSSTDFYVKGGNFISTVPSETTLAEQAKAFK
jgi:hypothetical protein